MPVSPLGEVKAWSINDSAGRCIAIAEGNTKAEADAFTAKIVADKIIKFKRTGSTTYKVLAASDIAAVVPRS